MNSKNRGKKIQPYYINQRTKERRQNR